MAMKTAESSPSLRPSAWKTSVRRPLPWWAAIYLLGGALIAGIGAVLPSGSLATAATLGACLLALPLLLVMSGESLLVLTVLALPFDTWRLWGVLSPPNFIILIATFRLALGVILGIRKLRPTFAYLPLTAIALSLTISTLLSPNPSVSFRLLVSVLGAICFAVLLVNFMHVHTARERVIDAVFLAGILLGGSAIVQYIAYQFGYNLWDPIGSYYVYNLGGYQLKVTGLSNVPANLATYVMPAFALGLFLWTYPMAFSRRWALKLATVLCFLAMFLTWTRASLLAMSLLVAGLVISRSSARFKNPKVVVSVMLVLTLSTSLFVLPSLAQSLNSMNPSSTFARVSIYLGAWDSFLENPLFGSGLGSMVMQDWENVELYNLLVTQGSSSAVRDFLRVRGPRDTHSTPIQIAVSLGLTGLTAFGWLVFAMLKRGLSAYRRAPHGSSMIAAVWMATAGMAVLLLFNDGLAMKPMWMLMGLVWALAPGTGLVLGQNLSLGSAKIISETSGDELVT